MDSLAFVSKYLSTIGMRICSSFIWCSLTRFFKRVKSRTVMVFDNSLLPVRFMLSSNVRLWFRMVSCSFWSFLSVAGSGLGFSEQQHKLRDPFKLSPLSLILLIATPNQVCCVCLV